MCFDNVHIDLAKFVLINYKLFNKCNFHFAQSTFSKNL